jgi:hypothetical protein
VAKISQRRAKELLKIFIKFIKPRHNTCRTERNVYAPAADDIDHQRAIGATARDALKRITVLVPEEYRVRAMLERRQEKLATDLALAQHHQARIPQLEADLHSAYFQNNKIKSS